MTIIKAGAKDMAYLEFFPMLNAAMISAWHQPKVGDAPPPPPRVATLPIHPASLASPPPS